MRKILSLPILVATLFLAGCENADPTSSSQSVGETVTLAPRIVRSALVPDHLFLGTDDVRIQVVSSNSSFHYDKTVPFADRGVTIDKVPATAQVVISLEGLDPSGNLLWSGASESFLASAAASSGFDIPLEPQSGVMPYQSSTSWFWSEVRNADTTVEWLNFYADGSYSRQLVTWNIPVGTASRDTFYGIYEAGAYLRKGETLELEPDLRDSCAWRGTNGNECGLSAPNWIESYPARYVSTWSHSASASLPFTFEDYGYIAAPARIAAIRPFVLAPSTWTLDSAGTSLGIEYAANYRIRFDTDGTYLLNLQYTQFAGTLVIAAARQTGTWTGNREVLNIVPVTEAVCSVDEFVVSCANPANLRSVPTDSIGTPSALTWASNGTILSLFDPVDNVTQNWIREP